jgi:hypothetical protein
MSLEGIKKDNLTLLLTTLKEMNADQSTYRDIKDTWNRIGRREEFDSLGFGTKDEMQDWIRNNPYINI